MPSHEAGSFELGLHKSRHVKDNATTEEKTLQVCAAGHSQAIICIMAQNHITVKIQSQSPQLCKTWCSGAEHSNDRLFCCYEPEEEEEEEKMHIIHKVDFLYERVGEDALQITQHTERNYCVKSQQG